MNKKAQFDFSEMNPMSMAIGLLGGIMVFAVMGYTGKVQVGIIWRILGFILGAVGAYLIWEYQMNR